MEIIYAIPGLGTTELLFKNITVANYQLKVLSWPEPQPEWSLRDYAKTFLSQIDASKPINLMGVSFGGMLCCELSELIPVNKVVLISSCKNRNELPGSLKRLKFFPVQKLISERFYRRFAGRLSWIVGFKKNYLPEFIQMMQLMPANYFKYCINMIVNWDKKENHRIVYHIHGNADNLLPHIYLKNYEVVQKGNHAMIIYKTDEINQFLNKVFNGI